MSNPYRPSNGTEGCIFEQQFCDRCERERGWREDSMKHDACDIHTWALAVGIDHERYPAEWIEDGNGPRCTAFELETTND